MPDTALGARIVKVNHAGENGAVHIYAGQIAVARFTARHMLAELREFKAHEEQHRAIFAAELQRRQRPRCRSYLLCGWGGYVLGCTTALFGQHAIAATTVAVERVVLGHLQQQVQQLANIDENAVHAIAKIIEDEQRHHDNAAHHLQGARWWPAVLTPIVSASTETVIWLGMRL